MATGAGLRGRAEASASWALQELRARIHAGDLTGARAAAESLAPFWDSTATAQPPFLESVLDVATSLDGPSAAALLLRPFRIESLGPEHATAVADLVARYGEPWTSTVLDGWLGSRQSWAYQGDVDRLGWIQSLPLLCDALRNTGEPGAAAARRLLATSWRWLSEEIRLWVSYSPARHREERLELLGKPLARLLEATAVSGGIALRDAILAALREHGDNVLACLMPALRASTPLSQDKRRASGLDMLARDCAERLGETIARPPRDEDDWSIRWPPRLRLRPVRQAMRVPHQPIQPILRVAAGQGKAPAHPHPDRRGRAARPPRDQAQRQPVHPGLDRGPGTLRAGARDTAPGRDGPRVAHREQRVRIPILGVRCWFRVGELGAMTARNLFVRRPSGNT